jgi:hypothetical protein
MNGPQVKRGPAAGLSLLRATKATADNDSTWTTAWQQFLDGTTDERILLGPIAASVVESDYDDSTDSQQEQRQQQQDGMLIITSDRLVYWVLDDAAAASDIEIPGVCVALHAVTLEPVVSVYMQLMTGGDNDDEMPLELTIVPIAVAQEEENAEDDCHAIAGALSELIAMHPIDPNGDSDDNAANDASMVQMMMMQMGAGMCGDTNDDTDDDLVIGATPSERDVMLARLDNLLMVPPELELLPVVCSSDDDDVGGGTQFDDADDA